MTNVRIAFVFAACSAGGMACGGAPAMASPAADSNNGATEAAPPVAPNNSTSSTTASVDVAGAKNELARAESQIQASSGDCASACRALASMERAVEHLCAIDSGAECRSARERMNAARDHVRATCGDCQ